MAPRVLLSWDKVEHIRAMATSEQPKGWKRDLAQKYGVDPSTISRILNGSTWIKQDQEMGSARTCN